MALSNATRLSDFGSGIGTQGAILQVNNTAKRVGIGTTNPAATLEVGSGSKIIMDGNAGVITATSFSGDGSNITGIGVTLNVRTETITTSGIATFENATTATSTTTGSVRVTGGVGVGKDIFVGDSLDVAKDIKVGAAATITGITNVTGVANFASAVNVDATTDSTSTSTGALIVDGGVGIAKNVYIGAGLSVAGTLTYEDVTSVDSVGMVTAKSGVNITGGELTVGSGITMGIAGVATFSGTADVHLLDNVKLKIGDSDDITIYHNGSDNYIDCNSAAEDHLYIRANTGGDMSSNIYIQAKSGENSILCADDESVSLFYDNSEKLVTTNEGINVSGMVSVTAGLGITGGMWEGAFIKAGKLTDNKTLGISTSNIFVFTTQESTTGTPNIIWNDSYALSSKMNVGDVVTITVITTAAAGGYCANWTIDGNAVSEQWNGGSAPSEGGSDGYDIYTHTIVRKAAGTGDTGWLMFSNLSNFT